MIHATSMSTAVALPRFSGQTHGHSSPNLQPPWVPPDSTPTIPYTRPTSYLVPDGLRPKGMQSPATLFTTMVHQAKTRVPEVLTAFIEKQQATEVTCKSLFDAGYGPGAMALADHRRNSILFAEEFYPLVEAPIPEVKHTRLWPLSRPKKISIDPPKTYVLSRHPQKSLVSFREEGIPLESIWGHEAGHLLDWWAGRQFGRFTYVSYTPEFQCVSRMDMQKLTPDQRQQVLRWIDLPELFTDSCLELLGLPGVHRLRHHRDEPMGRLFPSTQNWIYRTLQQLHMVPNSRMFS